MANGEERAPCRGLAKKSQTVDGDRLRQRRRKMRTRCGNKRVTLIMRQSLCKCHVEPEVLEHLRVSPAFKVLVLPLGERCLAAAGQFGGRRRAPEPIQITHAAGRQRVKRQTRRVRQ